MLLRNNCTACPVAVAQSVASALPKTEQVRTWIKSWKGRDLGFGVKRGDIVGEPSGISLPYSSCK